MIRWMCGVSLKYRRRSEEFRKLVGVQPITTVVRSGRMRLYDHVMRGILQSQSHDSLIGSHECLLSLPQRCDGTIQEADLADDLMVDGET